MIETRSSEIDIDELKARIRLAVERREAEGQISFAKATAELFDLLSREDFSLDRWIDDSLAGPNPSSAISDVVLQPEFVPQESGYHVNDLLKYHDHQFIWNAYRALLKREPDEVGLRRNLQELRSGRLNKIDIMARLRYSAEGEGHAVPIEGLRLPALIRRGYRIPVIGYLIELVAIAGRLPSLVHAQRQSENYMVGQMERITDQLNHTQRALLAQLGRQAELLEGLKSAISEVAREQKQLARLQHQQLTSLFRKHSLNGQPAEKKIDEEPHQSDDQQEEIDELNAAFQARFRGENAAAASLEAYLPLFDDAGIDSDILDIGCGAGEWLALLQEAGLRARGVESNRALVGEALQRNAVVIEADATRYLRTLPEDSLHAVTALHFVEHLELQDMIDLLKEVRRTLKPGGLLILETPNPKNLVVGACNFYSDPTHQRPLFPESLQFVVNHLGFERTSVRYLRPVEGSPFEKDDEGSRALHSWFFGPRDYAVIAYKPGGRAQETA
jgi:SAM-dependent methyltransferase